MSGRLYLVRALGDGSDAHPWCVPIFDPRAGQIYLAGPHALQWLPEPVRHWRYHAIGGHPHERLSNPRHRWLGNRLSLSLNGTRIAAEVIAELLTVHADPTGRRGWKPLQPSKTRLQYEIWLGEHGVIWRRSVPPNPSTQTLIELWPTVGAINSGQTFGWAADSGDAPDAVDATPDYVTIHTVNQQERARCTTSLDTADNECSGAIILNGAGNYSVTGRVRCRTKNDGTDEGYQAFGVHNTGAGTGQRNLERRQVGSNATLYTDTTDPGASAFTLGVKADGSSITGTWGAFTNTQSDMAVTGHLQCGLQLFVATGGAVGEIQLRSLTMADVVTAGQPAARRFGMADIGRAVHHGHEGVRIS